MYYFSGTTGGIMGLAFLVDLVVWYKASRIDINPEHNDAPKPIEDIPNPITLPQDSSSTPLTAMNNDTNV